MRAAVALALCGHALFLLGVAGWLRPWAIVVVLSVIVIACVRPDRRAWWIVPLVPLALYPPLAFDETLYHLPFVRAFARDGALRFLPELRFPVFPVLHELLCVPPYLVAGDRATHLVSLLEAAILVAVLVDWGGKRAGWLAAAMFLGSPLVVYLSTILYVEMALTLFVAAGFLALERERFVVAGFLLGTACAVKYLGFYFVLAAFVILIVRRRGGIAAFALACAAAALPMTLWIFLQSGDPFFPYVRESLWTLPPMPPLPWSERIVRMLRVPWDVTFARERVGLEPPMTPFLIPLLALVVAARVRWLGAIGAIYLFVFTFLPRDSRYLMPLLPLVCVFAAMFIAARWPKAVLPIAVLAIAPGLAYAGYRVHLQGLPPRDADAWLAQRVPEYRALQQTGTARVYACGAERLKAYAKGELLGDFAGPYSFDRILGGADLAGRLTGIHVRYYLVAKGACAPPRDTRGLELVYEDAAAQVWLVTPARDASRRKR